MHLCVTCQMQTLQIRQTRSKSNSLHARREKSPAQAMCSAHMFKQKPNSTAKKSDLRAKIYCCVALIRRFN